MMQKLKKVFFCITIPFIHIKIKNIIKWSFNQKETPERIKKCILIKKKLFKINRKM